MIRDNMSQEDAEELLSEARGEAEHIIDNDGSLDEIEDILKDYFGLEPDYMFDLIEL